jgi:hypothetical protein
MKIYADIINKYRNRIYECIDLDLYPKPSDVEKLLDTIGKAEMYGYENHWSTLDWIKEKQKNVKEILGLL